MLEGKGMNQLNQDQNNRPMPAKKAMLGIVSMMGVCLLILLGTIILLKLSDSKMGFSDILGIPTCGFLPLESNKASTPDILCMGMYYMWFFFILIWGLMCTRFFVSVAYMAYTSQQIFDTNKRKIFQETREWFQQQSIYFVLGIIGSIVLSLLAYQLIADSRLAATPYQAVQKWSIVLVVAMMLFAIFLMFTGYAESNTQETMHMLRNWVRRVENPPQNSNGRPANRTFNGHTSQEDSQLGSHTYQNLAENEDVTNTPPPEDPPARPTFRP